MRLAPRHLAYKVFFIKGLVLCSECTTVHLQARVGALIHSKVNLAGNVCLVSLHGYLRVLVVKARPFGSGLLGPMTMHGVLQ